MKLFFKRHFNWVILLRCFFRDFVIRNQDFERLEILDYIPYIVSYLNALFSQLLYEVLRAEKTQ